MYVTRLEPIGKNRTKVYIDEEFAFLLYPYDIKKYNIILEEEISDNLFFLINEEVILKRAKNKAISLLAKCEQSEKMIRRKLKNAYYTELIIDKVIDFLYLYKYIDDERYAISYIHTYAQKKGISLIKRELYSNGIDKEKIEELIALHNVDDTSNLKNAIYSKLSRITIILDDKESTNKMRKKIINHFMRKGYTYNEIVMLIDEYVANEIG